MSYLGEIAPHIHLLDNGIYHLEGFGGVYLLDEERKAVVDTGPAVCIPAVLDGIKKAGARPEDIAYIIVTHIHLDHAGGAGVLLKSLPNARILVHQRGARHLIDPSRLLASTLEVQGPIVMEKYYGQMVPAPADRVKSVADGEKIELGKGQSLTFLDTPGHAPHELCITESRNNGIFTGDALGIMVGSAKILIPFHPPPNFDLEACRATSDRLMKLKPHRIYYAHFGASDRGEETLRKARAELEHWATVAPEAIKGRTLDQAVEKMVAALMPGLEPIRGEQAMYNYLLTSSLPRCSRGFLKYFQEKQEQKKIRDDTPLP